MCFWSQEAAEEASRCRQCSTLNLFTVKPKATGGLSCQRLKVVTGKMSLSCLTLSYIWCLHTRTCTGEACVPAGTRTSWCCVIAGGLWARWREDLRRGFLGDRFRGPDLWVRGVQSFQPFCMFGATIMGWNLRLCTQQQTTRCELTGHLYLVLWFSPCFYFKPR